MCLFIKEWHWNDVPLLSIPFSFLQTSIEGMVGLWFEVHTALEIAIVVL
jgi:hypothetical protein